MQPNGYGLMVTLGLVASGLVGWRLTKREGLIVYDLILLATVTVPMGMVGAKLLFLIQNARDIDWSRIVELDYLRALIGGGFVFYGGIPLGLLGFWLAEKLFKIEGRLYLRLGMPLLPLTHAFGRIGCHLAGCCFGIHYSGPMAVIYPHNQIGTPAEVPLFPVQMLEAAIEFGIFALLLWLYLRDVNVMGLLGTYLVVYGAARFGLEFLRDDAIRGFFGALSTSQWISIAGVVLGVICLVCSRKGPKQAPTPET